ncbi:MAG TPA: PAS domain-containing protein, partial [Candidatus Paceibacterota bacterium]|nr:PAS domain-containing protein [Candidatus Paceibacterota bacterium]
PAVLGTSLDITEKKKAEAALAEASSLLETLLANSPDCIYFKDRESRFVRTTASMAKLFRVSSPADLFGKTDFDVFRNEHARAAFDDEQRIIRTGEPIIGKPEQETHSDGRVTWALTTKLPWRDKDGNIIGTFGISKDVTPLKEAERRLAYEQDLFTTLLGNLPDSIYFKDLESRFVRVSRSEVQNAFERCRLAHEMNRPNEPMPEHLSNLNSFGEHLIGKSDFDIHSEERARASFEDEQTIIRTGNPLLAKIEHERKADGKSTWTISTKMPWRNKDGQIIGTFGVSKDITQLKEAEAQLETAHQRLIETSRLAGMAEVATDVLHNVGNVLNSVNISCSLTIDRIRTSKMTSLAKVAALLEEHRGRLPEFFSSDPRGQQVPDYIKALAEHLQGDQAMLLNELGQLLKHIDHIKQIVVMQQSYAKVAGVKEIISPRQLVEDALHINAAALVRHDVHVKREFQDTTAISTEKHKVLQILVNLIRNAKYAMDDAKRADKLLTLRVAPGENCVKIEVNDNGVGIPHENLTRIFGHGFTTRRNGHGFGLHSSALAVKELGGSLEAHSNGPGTGATFTLTLPLTPENHSMEPSRYESATI